MNLPDTYRGPHRDRSTAGPKYGAQVHDLVQNISNRGARVSSGIRDKIS